MSVVIDDIAVERIRVTGPNHQGLQAPCQIKLDIDCLPDLYRLPVFDGRLKTQRGGRTHPLLPQSVWQGGDDPHVLNDAFESYEYPHPHNPLDPMPSRLVGIDGLG